MFIFKQKHFKTPVSRSKKDCTSQDSNPGPQHWDFENRPVGVQGLFSYCLLYNDYINIIMIIIIIIIL